MGFLGKPKNWKPNYIRITLCLLLLIVLCVGIVFVFSKNSSKNEGLATSSAPVQEEPKPDITINVVALGDIMCHSTNFKAVQKNGTYDFSGYFTDIQDYISNADLAISNLETTFAGESRGYSGYPTFNSPASLGQAIFNIGVDVVSTANNHSLDKGYSGLTSTLDELDRIGLAHTGTYRSTEEQNTILTKEINGIKFAFLSFTYGTNGIPVPKGKEYCINLIDRDLIKSQINLAKEQSPDVICVNMHWGLEYKLKQNSEQEDLANFLFENGVDIIFGSHPHVLEPMEKRTITLEDGSTKDGFVIYSLGNFMSGQTIKNTKNSIILNLQITKHGADNKISIDSVKYTPIYMLDRGARSSNRYQILDIKKRIENFENGTDKSIGQSTYNILKAELTNIVSVMGEEIN